MTITRLSSKGQVIIPKTLRVAHHWEPGQELVVIDTGDGVLLKPKAPFPPSELDAVAACLEFKGQPRSLEDMQEAIARGVQGRHK
mgnify:FL=1